MKGSEFLLEAGTFILEIVRESPLLFLSTYDGQPLRVKVFVAASIYAIVFLNWLNPAALIKVVLISSWGGKPILSLQLGSDGRLIR